MFIYLNYNWCITMLPWNPQKFPLNDYSNYGHLPSNVCLQTPPPPPPALYMHLLYNSPDINSIYLVSHHGHSKDPIVNSLENYPSLAIMQWNTNLPFHQNLFLQMQFQRLLCLHLFSTIVSITVWSVQNLCFNFSNIWGNMKHITWEASTSKHKCPPWVTTVYILM